MSSCVVRYYSVSSFCVLDATTADRNGHNLDLNPRLSPVRRNKEMYLVDMNKQIGREDGKSDKERGDVVREVEGDINLNKATELARERDLALYQAMWATGRYGTV